MLSRRHFIAGTATTVVAGSRARMACAQAANRVKVIDVHAHRYPPAWIELVKRKGEAAGAKITENARGQTVIQIPGLGVTLQQQYIDIPQRAVSTTTPSPTTSPP